MKVSPLTHLGNIPIQDFLNDYWQQKPLFIKNALVDWQAPLDCNDIAGSALEESVESRLIIENTSSNPLQSHWQMEHGPLPEERFANLPESHFTLLVQALDQISPEMHELLHRFRFLPNWRLDDIMASVAPKGGSVGPHFDYYDVFLLQATGSRQWQLGQHCHSQSPLQANCPLKILTEFDTQASYLAEPGDLLYIPANIAHWGVSQSDDCSTYSIGFRAPSYSDILLGLSEDIASQLSADKRYRDLAAGTVDMINPGLISAQVIEHITQECHALFTQQRVGEWLGQHLTELKRSSPQITTREIINTGADANADETMKEEHTDAWVLSSDVRVAYIIDPQNEDGATLFINGQPWVTSLSLASAISGYTPICPSNYSASDRAVIEQWIHDGYFSLP